MTKINQIILNDQNDKVLSPFCQAAQHSIVQKIEGEHQLWGRDDLEELMKKEYGQEVVDAFRKMVPYSYKSNLGRYVLLHHFGGWYFDLTIRIDSIMNVPDFAEIGAELLAFREVQKYTKTAYSMATSVLWVKDSGHPVFEKAIEFVLRNCREEYYGACPVSVSGPNLLGEAFAACRCNADIMIGDALELTPSHQIKNKAFVLPQGFILAWNKPVAGGDISSLGQQGTNNYNDFWRMKTVYGENLR
jgi:hypothetical protein|tara:strand:+ start:10565 stop:11302 length:738 start_codon:yes stop_codon:yes gene_type:complete